LPGAYVGSVIRATRESKVLQGSTAEFEPFEKASAGIGHQFKLNRPARLLLYDRSPCSNFPIANDIADPDLHQIASTKLTVDGKVKESPVADPPMLVEKEADRPYLTGFERSLRTNFAPGVPRHPLASSGIKFR
jgi:hypothetical protein